MSLNVDDFKAKLKTGGARPNLFRVTCNFPGFAGGDTELASFMIKSASLPGSTIGMITVPFRGRQIKIAGDRTFEDWSITVINDGAFKSRNAFERWSNVINNHIANKGEHNPLAYQTDMMIEQLDRNDQVVKKYTIRGVFPTVVAPIEVSYESNDAVEEFSVTLAYQYWESDTTT